MKTLVEVNNKVDPDISSDAISTIVTLHENGLPMAILIANNDRGKAYLETVKLYDTLTIKMTFEDTETIDWDNVEPIFKGKVIDINPTINVRGETISVTAITGECLKQMRVSQEYGKDSDVVKEIFPGNFSEWIEYTWYDYGEEDFDEELPVNVWIYEHQDWTHVGTEPYLHDADASNYISDAVNPACIGDYDQYYMFDSLSNYYYDVNNILQVTVRIFCGMSSNVPDEVQGVTIKVWLYDGNYYRYAGEVYVDNRGTYQWKETTINMKDYFNSLSKIDNARLKIMLTGIEYTGNPSWSGSVNISCVRLHVKGHGYYRNNCIGKPTGILGDIIVIETFTPPENQRVLFNRACAYHEGNDNVKLYYRFGTTGDWIDLGDPIYHEYSCRYVNPNNTSDFVYGNINQPLQVKWHLTNPSGPGYKAMCNLRAYYNFTDTPQFRKPKTLREILCGDNGLDNFTGIDGNNYGAIVPFYIEKIFGGNDSGYRLNTDYVYNWNKEYTYLNFPYTDALYCINELIKIGTCMSYKELGSEYRGLHWILLPNVDNDTPYLLIAPIAEHHVLGVNNSIYIDSKWKSHYENTLIVKQDMIRKQFKTEIPLANYVLVAGKYIYPINDNWTEFLNGWKYHDNVIVIGYLVKKPVSLSLGNDSPFMRNYYLKEDLGDTGTVYCDMYRDDINIELSKLKCEDNPPKLLLAIRQQNCSNVKVLIGQDKDNVYYLDITNYLSSNSSKWVKIELDISDEALNNEWSKYGNPTSNNITFLDILTFRPALGHSEIHVDGLMFTGNVIRAAYTSDCGKINREDCTVGCIKHYGCRMYTVKDSIAQTDSLDPNDDGSALAQVALYELLRHRVPRTTGSVEIPLTLDILPGQIVHVKACEQVADNGSVIGYKIDKDFRITKVEHKFSVEGCTTTLELTDDLRNGLPINTQDPYTTILRAVNPDTQTKTYASLKASGSFYSDLKVIAKNYSY